MLTKFLTSVFVVAVPVAAFAGSASTSTPVKPAADPAAGCATPSKSASGVRNPFDQASAPAAAPATGCAPPSKPSSGIRNPFDQAGSTSAPAAASATGGAPPSKSASGVRNPFGQAPAAPTNTGPASVGAGKPATTNTIAASGGSGGKTLRVPVIATFVALVDDNANKAEPEVCLSVGALSPAATALVNYNDRKAKEGDVGADVTRLHAVGALAVQGVNALRQACRAKTPIASAAGMLRDTAAALRSIDADANVWVK
ncbi:MAG TPA: hypothetical protein PLF40_10455 [Kofleriaceae bacterium]|nr:hypothetical protein [Kofleriaceae bacterium]